MQNYFCVKSIKSTKSKNMNLDTEQFEILLDHYNYPKKKGELDSPDISHEEGNPLCGDKIKLDIKLENNKIKDIRFSGEGCVISQASASILSEFVEGKDLEEIKKMDAEDIFNLLGIRISPIRYKCALLALKALKSALFGTKEWPEVAEENIT